jgi:3-oxoacyl-[acyl-carrier protein] reductase
MDAYLRDKVGVVTGGSSGVGAATVCLLSEAGAVVVAASRGQVAAEQPTAGAADIAAAGTAIPLGTIGDPGLVHAMRVHVGDWGLMEAFAAGVEETVGPPEFVVGCAAVIDAVAMTWEVDPRVWAESVKINLVGAFNTLRAFLPGMVARDRGVIVLVSSAAAQLTTPGWGAYGTAKTGVDHLARVTQAELDLRGSAVRVHVLYPGVVDSPMQESIRSLSADEFPNVEYFRRLHAKGALRPPIEPATVATWLLTPAAADLRGKVANIDDPDIRARVRADLGIELP